MTGEDKIRNASNRYAFDLEEGDLNTNRDTFIAGVMWAAKNAWHDAQGGYLPEIDREVIVIDKNGKVSYGHRPNPDGWWGKPLDSNEPPQHFQPKTYDKGGWNIPDVKWWLDVDIP